MLKSQAIPIINRRVPNTSPCTSQPAHHNLHNLLSLQVFYLYKMSTALSTELRRVAMAPYAVSLKVQEQLLICCKLCYWSLLRWLFKSTQDASRHSLPAGASAGCNFSNLGPTIGSSVDGLPSMSPSNSCFLPGHSSGVLSLLTTSAGDLG